MHQLKASMVEPRWLGVPDDLKRLEQLGVSLSAIEHARRILDRAESHRLSAPEVMNDSPNVLILWTERNWDNSNVDRYVDLVVREDGVRFTSVVKRDREILLSSTFDLATDALDEICNFVRGHVAGPVEKRMAELDRLKLSEGALVKIKPCCGPGGEHEGFEDRCHDMNGKIMSITDYPHEHDHVRRKDIGGVWEVVELTEGVFVRRAGDWRTSLLEHTSLQILAPLEIAHEARVFALGEAEAVIKKLAQSRRDSMSTCSKFDTVSVADSEAIAAEALEEAADNIRNFDRFFKT